MPQQHDAIMEPRIASEQPGYIAVYKPPNMHTAPLRAGEGGTLLDWAASLFPEVYSVEGKKPVEGGLLHRLDFETSGLVLIARKQTVFDGLWEEQERGAFVKEYAAFSAGPVPSCGSRPGDISARKGFPPYPGPKIDPNDKTDCTIESAFRSYGPGGRAVRPLLDPKGRIYRTSIEASPQGTVTPQDLFSAYTQAYPQGRLFNVRLSRGFRHQIRCHLAWMGMPLLNDVLYGGISDGGFLALQAWALHFTDPETGKIQNIQLP
jgi:23S rRNA pseudouridine1911/1915/1917 synthase